MLSDYFTPLVVDKNEKAPGWDTAAAWVPIPGKHTGFIQPVSGSEVLKDGRRGEKATHRLYTGIRTPGKYGYRVTQNGQSYLMIYANQLHGVSGVYHHKEIILSVME